MNKDYQIKWRFPSNNSGQILGLSDSGIETFKNNPLKSLAKEIIQNSIDAMDDSKNQVIVEFSAFTIKNNNQIFDGLKKELINCLNYSREINNNQIKELEKMLEALNSDVNVLRISDFNTTGLDGVEKEVNAYSQSAWSSLVFSQGISNKNEHSGGSKGVGKFATFANSDLRTIFYSTYSKNGVKGYEGISRLCSAPLSENPKEMTQGIGYYGSNNSNAAILDKDLLIDTDFVRKDDQFGTDIYILGFSKVENWENDLIEGILTDFMYAIFSNKLMIKINDKTSSSSNNISISKINLKDYTLENSFLNKRNTRENIFLQYLLYDQKSANEQGLSWFNQENENLKFYLISKKTDVEKFEFEIPNTISMIRYPYMKIKDEKKKLSSLRHVMVACIIEEKGEIFKILREAENAEHNGWYFKRFTDLSLKRYAENSYNDLINKINNFVENNIQYDQTETSELYGTNNLFKIPLKNDYKFENTSKIKEATQLNKIVLKRKALQNDENNYVDYLKGNLGDEIVGAPIRKLKSEIKRKKDGKFNTTITVDQTDSKNLIGKVDFIILEDYDFLALNYKKGEYLIAFNPTIEKNNVLLELKLVNSDMQSEKIKIINAKEMKDNSQLSINNEGMIIINIVKNKQLLIKIKTNEKNLFGSEVILHV